MDLDFDVLSPEIDNTNDETFVASSYTEKQVVNNNTQGPVYRSRSKSIVDLHEPSTSIE